MYRHIPIDVCVCRYSSDDVSILVTGTHTETNSFLHFLTIYIRIPVYTRYQVPGNTYYRYRGM